MKPGSMSERNNGGALGKSNLFVVAPRFSSWESCVITLLWGSRYNDPPLLLRLSYILMSA